MCLAHTRALRNVVAADGSRQGSRDGLPGAPMLSGADALMQLRCPGVRQGSERQATGQWQ